jgi:hypothetical protein
MEVNGGRMKKMIAAVAMVAMCAMMQQVRAEESGGLKGLLVGCCFGVRAAGAVNEGKHIGTDEWISLFTANIWAGILGLQGTTTADLVKKSGANFY